MYRRRKSQHIAINGQTVATIVHTDDYTGYVSPYFVMSKGKFTKHYFEGAGRIVSKLGNGAFAQPLGITAGGINYTNLTAEQQKAMDLYVKSLGLPPGPPTQQGIYATPEFTGDPYPTDVLKPTEENQEPPEGWPRNPVFNKPGDVPGPPVQFGPPVEPETVKPAEGFTGIGLPENDIFYFHPDHLGSTSYITTRNGSISQHVEYIAFGEVLFEEHSSSFSSPYLFNGKELDRETNLSYYGARYLDMKTSLWLSLDKEGENDLSVGGYVYSFNNPINFIDPDGNWPDPPTWKSVKTYWSYQVNTKIPNDLKKIGRELDNGWRAEKYLKGGKAEGYDFRSDLKRGEDTTGKAQKGKGDRNTQIVDITGIDVLSAYIGLSTGAKTVSKSGKIVDVASDFAKAAKSVSDGLSLGSDTGEMFNQAKDQITMKLEYYSASSTTGWNKSQIDKKERDTTVDNSQKNVINRMNKMNRARAEQQRNSNNSELQKKIDYYKQ